MSENLLAPMEFDILPAEVPVTVGTERFVLREADGETSAKYKTLAARCARMVDGSVTGMDGIGELEPFLVAGCLCLTDDGATAKLDSRGAPLKVGIARVKAFRARVQADLFERAKAISGLLDGKDTTESLEKEMAKLRKRMEKLSGGDEEAKNSQDATTDGSA